MLGVRFLLQLFSDVGEVTMSSVDCGSVAFFAHIGGFIAGMVLVKLFVAFSPGRQESEL